MARCGKGISSEIKDVKVVLRSSNAVHQDTPRHLYLYIILGNDFLKILSVESNSHAKTIPG